jgi:hypothetical protein
MVNKYKLNNMRNVKSKLLAVLTILIFFSCSSPETKIRKLITNGYEVTNGKFDNSDEEDKLSELISQLKEDEENIKRSDITKIWEEVRIEYWTKEMTECFNEELKNISVEDITGLDANCSDVSIRIFKDYGKLHQVEAAEAIIIINESAFKKWKSNQ